MKGPRHGRRPRCSSLTVDYGEHFKLTVDFYFDRGCRSGVQNVLECHPCYLNYTEAGEMYLTQSSGEFHA